MSILSSAKTFLKNCLLFIDLVCYIFIFLPKINDNFLLAFHCEITKKLRNLEYLI